MPLTDTRLRALKPKDKPYKVTDERGLYVEVTPTGGKLWRFRYRIGGAQKKLCIGSYPDISLKQARDEAYEARRAVASGGDPAFEKRKRKIRAEFLSAQTFEAVAREYIEQMMVQNGRADGTIVKANYFLDKLAPAIGNRPIDEIEPFEVLAPLKRLEATGKHETAKKCRSFAGRVFRYGVATTRCKSDPTSMLKGALVTPRATHYAAILEPTELGGLLRAIDDFTGYMVTKLALQIAPHVFVRPGELRHAEWHEIDLVDGVWKIPAGKMKARRAHAVPLSKQVRGYLTDLAEMLGREGYVFPSARSSKRPMSENTLNAAFRRMGYSKEEVTAHGLYLPCLRKRMRLRIGTRGYEFRDFFDCCQLIGAGLRQKAEHHVLKGDHPDAQLDHFGIGKWRNIPFLTIGSERFLRPAGQCPAFVFPARQRTGFSRFRHMRFLS